MRDQLQEVGEEHHGSRGQQRGVMLQEDVQDIHGVLLDAWLDMGHSAGQVSAEEWEERSHLFCWHRLCNEPATSFRDCVFI